MALLTITVGRFVYRARLEESAAPRTCATFLPLLPLENRIIQARWSGEAAWVPLGDFQIDVGFENHTSHPAPGEILLYPGGFSETEILFPYGPTLFASKGSSPNNLSVRTVGTGIPPGEKTDKAGRLFLDGS